MEDIDVEKLTCLVQERPVLWDKSLDDYKSRNLTVNGWKEVCCKLIDGFKSLSDKQKNEFGKIVLKKWTNLKDCWIRSEKKIASQKKLRAGKITAKRYIYHEQLAFLKKNQKLNETELSFSKDNSENIKDIDDPRPNASFANEKRSPPKMKQGKKTKVDEIGCKILHALETSDDRHTHFFKGILPSLQQLNEDEILHFQLGVMNLLIKIRNNRVSATYPHQTVPSGYPVLNDHPTLNFGYPLPNYLQTVTSKQPVPHYLQSINSAWEKISEVVLTSTTEPSSDTNIEGFNANQHEYLDVKSPISEVSDQSLQSIDFSTN